MDMGEAIRAAILAWDPNEEEVLDEVAVSQLAAYLNRLEYDVEDIVQPKPDRVGGDDWVYSLYDLLRWTRQEQEVRPGETVVLKLEDLG